MSKRIKHAISRANAYMADMKRRIKSDVTATMRTIDAQLVALGLTPDFRVSDSSWDLTVTGNCNTRTLVLAVFQTHGYKPMFEPKDGESYYSTWMLHENRDRFWFSFANTACERVKVGTKMVEQDVYETRCTD